MLNPASAAQAFAVAGFLDVLKAALLSTTPGYLFLFAAAQFASGVRQVSTKAAGLSSRVTAVLGSQWGDEGKGKLADILAKQ